MSGESLQNIRGKGVVKALTEMGTVHIRGISTKNRLMLSAFINQDGGDLDMLSSLVEMS